MSDPNELFAGGAMDKAIVTAEFTVAKAKQLEAELLSLPDEQFELAKHLADVAIKDKQQAAQLVSIIMTIGKAIAPIALGGFV